MTAELIEKCLKAIPNRFMLVCCAAQRSRELEKDSTPLVDMPPNERKLMIALHEIAEKKITQADLEERIVKALRIKYNKNDKSSSSWDEVSEDDEIIPSFEEEQEVEKLFDQIDEQNIMQELSSDEKDDE